VCGPKDLQLAFEGQVHVVLSALHPEASRSLEVVSGKRQVDLNACSSRLAEQFLDDLAVLTSADEFSLFDTGELPELLGQPATVLRLGPGADGCLSPPADLREEPVPLGEELLVVLGHPRGQLTVQLLLLLSTEALQLFLAALAQLCLSLCEVARNPLLCFGNECFGLLAGLLEDQLRQVLHRHLSCPNQGWWGAKAPGP